MSLEEEKKPRMYESIKTSSRRIRAEKEMHHPNANATRGPDYRNAILMQFFHEGESRSSPKLTPIRSKSIAPKVKEIDPQAP
jgi:hypothetical protein